jgi:[acyl-carrier-protein] S-malonyltransferase
MKTAFLFPGQGAQTIGMGADLYGAFADYKEVFDQCAAGSGIDLKAACFEGAGMDDGQTVQPAIVAHSLGLHRILENSGVKADAYAGLSLGEYTALCAAGALEPSQCAALVRRRGRIMDEAFEKDAAGMLSVIGLPLGKIETLIEGVKDAYVANHLSDAQVVVAGYSPALLALKDVFMQAGARMAVLLSVRGPSHAPLLHEAATAFAVSLKDERFLPFPGQTVYAGALGAPYPEDAEVKELLVLQMESRLRWHDCVEHMIQSGVDRFVEVGPGNVLSKLVSRRVGKDATVVSVRDAVTLQAFLQTEGT